MTGYTSPTHVDGLLTIEAGNEIVSPFFRMFPLYHHGDFR